VDPPSRWQGTPPPAAFLANDVVMVHSHRPEPAWTSGPLAPGGIYILEVTGTFSIWPDESDVVDANYEWSPRRDGPQPRFQPQLLIDDRPMSEYSGGPVPFSPGHVYTATVRGTGQRLKLQIADARNGSWGDNHGALQVRVFRR
jgi:hypothetical protein